MSLVADPDADAAGDVWTGSPEAAHAATIREARDLIAARHLGRPTARKTVVHLAAEWAIGVAVAIAAHLVDTPGLWVVSVFVLAWVFAGNAAIMHEGVHGHLFRSKFANRFLGTVAVTTLFLSFATYRAYHWEHHAHTAEADDPEGAPLSIPSRILYAVAIVLGGLYVLLENLFYTVITLVGRPPKWARAKRHRRAIATNALVTALTVGVLLVALHLSARVTLEVWILPAGIALFLLLPILLLPEHYGASGVGDILSSTRSVKSNPLLRWFFWNTNYHAAHHLAPSVPFSNIALIDAVVGRGRVEAKWRLGSYTAFHVGNLTRLAYNKAPDAAGESA